MNIDRGSPRLRRMGPRPVGAPPLGDAVGMRSLVLRTVCLVAAAVLAGCGADDAKPGQAPGPVVQAADGHVPADVTFAKAMIPHHAQAMSLADIARDRAEAAEIKALADRIQAAQAPEIEQMAGWLSSWGEEVPATGRDHASAHGDTEGDDHAAHPDMPGMVSEERLQELESASGEAFDRLFLTLMIEHHEGALAMARTQRSAGRYPAAVALAAAVEAAQTAEIARMRQLLATA